MDTEELIKKVPFTPPQGMKSWLWTLPRKEYIIFKAGWRPNLTNGSNERVAECVCTACESMFAMPYVASGMITCHGMHKSVGFRDDRNEIITSYNKCICPVCGTVATAIHAGDMNNPHRKNEYVISVHKVDDAAAIIRWNAKYMVYKDGRTDYEIVPDEAYLFTKKKWVRMCAWEPGIYGFKRHTGHWVARKRCEDMVNVIKNDHILPFGAKELDGTVMENSKLDLYLKCCEWVYPVSYLRLYQLHNNIENILTGGFGHVISDKIKRYCPGNGYSSNYGKLGSVRNIKGIDFKKSKPHEMLGLSKEEYRFAIRDEWDERMIEYYKFLKPFGADMKDVGWYVDVIPFNCKRDFVEFADKTDADGHAVKFDKHDIGKTASYLMKQQKKYDEDDAEWHMLYDYWNMLIQLGSDYNDPEIRYPQRLKRAHDQAAAQIRYKKNKETDEAFKRRYNRLSRFSYFDDVLEIHPARSAYEMENEGKKLHHCVASYINSHAAGKTSIFFIRHRIEPDKPYFTLEFDFEKMKVVQNRGMRNCDRTDEVKEFEDKWVERVKKIVSEDKENGKQNRIKAAAA